MSLRLPPKISLKHEWRRELGSEVARQPEGEVARQAKCFQPTQPTPNPIRDRTGRLVETEVIQVKTARVFRCEARAENQRSRIDSEN